MKKEVMANMDMTAFPIIGLFCFLAVFIGVIFWIYRKNSSAVYADAANSALDEGELVSKGDINER